MLARVSGAFLHLVFFNVIATTFQSFRSLSFPEKLSVDGSTEGAMQWVLPWLL
jgi:hypothetical protein